MALLDAFRKLFPKKGKKRKKDREQFKRGNWTRQKRGGKRHRPYTKSPTGSGESKIRRKMAATSRRINRERTK